MPAVRRPALRSVTRRTLKSVLARDLIINLFLAIWRTLFRSPCLRRREDPLPQPPYVILDPPPVNLAPVEGRVLWFVTNRPTVGAMASNLSSGSGASIIFLLTGSPDRVSTLSGWGHTRVRIRPVI